MEARLSFFSDLALLLVVFSYVSKCRMIRREKPVTHVVLLAPIFQYSLMPGADDRRLVVPRHRRRDSANYHVVVLLSSHVKETSQGSPRIC